MKNYKITVNGNLFGFSSYEKALEMLQTMNTHWSSYAPNKRIEGKSNELHLVAERTPREDMLFVQCDTIADSYGECYGTVIRTEAGDVLLDLTQGDWTESRPNPWEREGWWTPLEAISASERKKMKSGWVSHLTEEQLAPLLEEYDE
jgi:hypothetical protein